DRPKACAVSHRKRLARGLLLRRQRAAEPKHRTARGPGRRLRRPPARELACPSCHPSRLTRLDSSLGWYHARTIHGGYDIRNRRGPRPEVSGGAAVLRVSAPLENGGTPRGYAGYDETDGRRRTRAGMGELARHRSHRPRRAARRLAGHGADEAVR